MMISLLLALAPQAQPDIVIFLWDDVGARTVELLRAANPSRLPTVDFLAEQGTTFSAGYAYPMCAPARSAFLRGEWVPNNAGFGCHPNTDGTGVGSVANTLPNGTDNMAQAMEAAGYHTAFFGRWAIGTFPADPGGDDSYAMAPGLFGFETWRAVIPDGTEACGGSGYSDWLRVDDGQVSSSTQYHTLALGTEFVTWWANTPSPRFAFVSFQAAHDPFHFPPSNAMPPGWTQPQPGTTRQQYEAMVQSADYLMGGMIGAILLEDEGLYDTLLIFAADNGDPQAVPPNGYTSNEVKFSTFDGGVRVPYFVSGWGFPADQVSAQPVSIVDWCATLTDVAGACSSYPNPDGQSILPALVDCPLSRSWVYSGKGDGHHMVREELWKLRETPGSPPLQFLYDMAADPFENAPIDPDASGYEDVTMRLRAALAEAQG